MRALIIDSPPASAAPGSPRRGLRLLAGALAGVVGIVFVGAYAAPAPARSPTDVLFLSEDAAWLMALAAALFGFSFMGGASGRLWRALAARPVPVLAGLALGVATLAWVGTRIVFLRFAYTPDEAMAAFDSVILQNGALYAPVPEPWRAFVPAMAPWFRLPVEGNGVWLSSYLPGNAALRALFGALGDATLTGPALTALSVVLVFAIARRLWPRRRDAALVAAALVALSPQVLVTAMTPFAMTGHLAINLLWLWCFLRDDGRGRIGAACVGFVGVGMHQLIFHPLFAAPFIAQLALRRRWGAFAFYGVAYALIGLFWINYQRIVLPAGALGGPPQDFSGASSLIARVQTLFVGFDWSALDAMIKNALRFLAWQHLLLAPLALAGLMGLRDGPPALRAIVGGFALVTLACLLLMPEQGLGWGYRYWHGLIGGAALLGASGFIGLTERFETEAPAVRRMVVLTSLATLTVSAPLHAWFAHARAAPYARAEAAMAAAPADFVVVDTSGFNGLSILVRNDPFLRDGGPKMFNLFDLDEPLLRELCARGGVAIFDSAQAGAFGLRGSGWPERDARLAELRGAMRALECGATPVVRAP